MSIASTASHLFVHDIIKLSVSAAEQVCTCYLLGLVSPFVHGIIMLSIAFLRLALNYN